MKPNHSQKKATQGFRKLLSALTRVRIKSTVDKEKAAKHLGLDTTNTIGTMMYRGQGGMDAWIILLSHLYNIKPEQLPGLFDKIKELFQSKRKLSKGEALWAKLGETLTEDEKFFWCGLAQGVQASKPPFIIKQKKK